MLPYFELERLSHNSKHVDIKASFRESSQLALIKTPTVWNSTKGEFILDINCRFFTDDWPYGLLIAKWIAEQLNVQTPFISELLKWSEGLRGEHWVDENTGDLDMKYCLAHKFASGIPPSYGIMNVNTILD